MGDVFQLDIKTRMFFAIDRKFLEGVWDAMVMLSDKDPELKSAVEWINREAFERRKSTYDIFGEIITP